MPKKFPVALPNATQRSNIFSLILRGTKTDPAHFSLDHLVRLSAGMSGSDIKEACRDAAMGPVREFIRRKKADGTLRSSRSVDPRDVRGLRTEDFFGGKVRAGEVETPHELNERSRRVQTTDEESEATTSSSESATEAGDPDIEAPAAAAVGR